ncbi:MAG: DUF1326 domain-containing protein [Capsulimonadales bacterium]|nr:DUF1326 domain-containing protein [Capsulimonadales bacterium]
MKLKIPLFRVLIPLLPALVFLPAAQAQEPEWMATGTLLEACTCAVPCTCNFGEGPSPNHYCHAVYGYRLDKARFGDVDLSGLVIAGADASGSLGFLDRRATPTQRAALEKLAYALFEKGGPSSGKRRFVSVDITHEVKGNDLRLKIAGYGGFNARVILGRDGTSPVVVENNTIWPIPRAIKAKTSSLTFRDKSAGTIDARGTNANYGTFSF